MNPEQYKKLYGHDPSPELMEAWESGPSLATNKRFEDMPIRGALYNAITDAGLSTEGRERKDREYRDAQARVPGFSNTRTLEGFTDPGLLVRGLGDVASGWLDPTRDPTKGEYAFGLLDALGLGGAKVLGTVGKEALGAFRANMPNLLEFTSRNRLVQPPEPGASVGENIAKMAGYTPPGGHPEQRVSFYSGNPIATAASLAEGLYRGTKSYVKQLYNLSDSHRWGTKKVSRLQVDGIKKHFETSESVMADPKSWVTDKSGVTKLTTKAKAALKRSEKTVAGDLNTMYALAEREGYEISDVVRAWGDIHWDTSRHINSVDLAPQLRDLKSVSADAAPTENSALIADMMNNIWEMGDDYVLAIQKPRKSSGAAASTSDAQMSTVYADAAKAYHAGARTADEFRAAGIKSKHIIDGENGSVLIQYSSDRMSDLFKGGFNAIAELTPNGKTTFWVSDKFDLLKGPAQAVMEVGMAKRLLTIMNPKTIRTPVIGAGKGAPTKRKIKKADAIPIKAQEEAAMKDMIADQDISALYKTRFLASRYGLPAVAAGGMLPDKNKRAQ